MPKISVSVPHRTNIETAAELARPALEKTAQDFQGRDLEIQWNEQDANYSFKSMGVTISGNVTVDDSQITVTVDLPIVAMMYKDKAEKAVRKNLTSAVQGQ